jgi:hypothetical protein
MVTNHLKTTVAKELIRLRSDGLGGLGVRVVSVCYVR